MAMSALYRRHCLESGGNGCNSGDPSFRYGDPYCRSESSPCRVLESTNVPRYKNSEL